jgi:hypothetical protein
LSTGDSQRRHGNTNPLLLRTADGAIFYAVPEHILRFADEQGKITLSTRT